MTFAGATNWEPIEEEEQQQWCDVKIQLKKEMNSLFSGNLK